MLKGLKKLVISFLEEGEDREWDVERPLISPDVFVPLPNLTEEVDDSNYRIRYNDLYHHGQLLNHIAAGLNEHHFKAGIRFGIVESKIGFLYGIIFTAVSTAVGIATRALWEPLLDSLMRVL